jgi:hypothetical protein
MARENHKDCYGRMFPQTLHLVNDQAVRGKVFAYQLSTAGGAFRADRAVTASLDAWDDCIACEQFDNCYKFSLGQLLLEMAVSEK